MNTLQQPLHRTFAKSYQEEILLSRIVGEISHQSLTLQVTIKAGVAVTIVDDLEVHAIQEGSLEFCLEEKASLNLRMRSLYGLYRISSAGQNDYIIPAYQTRFTEQQISSSKQVELKRFLIIRFFGDRAAADVRYACFGPGEKNFKFTVLQDHQAEHTTSKVVVRSVLEEQSQLFCKGLIHIRKDAQHTHAELENKNILLGDQARAVSIPTLEIEANDVVCKHGAAISKLDAEQFFYLQSRGIDGTSARIMLIESFLQ